MTKDVENLFCFGKLSITLVVNTTNTLENKTPTCEGNKSFKKTAV